VIPKDEVPCQEAPQLRQQAHSHHHDVIFPWLPFRAGPEGLQLLVVGILLLLHASHAMVSGGRALLVEFSAHGPMELFLEDRLGLNSLELGLEVLELMGAGVASAARIGHVVREVLYLVAFFAPIALSSAILLGLLRVFSRMPGFGEVAREMLLRFSGAVGEAGVVAVSELVRSSHDCLLGLRWM
jgi:hypothetical protein